MSNITEEAMETLSSIGDYIDPLDLGDTGICLSCGSVQLGCEPDAEKYECESCGLLEVMGIPHALLTFLF